MMAALNHESIGEKERRTYGRTYKADSISVEAEHFDILDPFFIKTPNIKYNGNSSSRSRNDTCGQTRRG